MREYRVTEWGKERRYDDNVEERERASEKWARVFQKFPRNSLFWYSSTYSSCLISWISPGLYLSLSLSLSISLSLSVPTSLYLSIPLSLSLSLFLFPFLFYFTVLYSQISKDSQKAILIGKGGMKLKELGTMAREKLEKVNDNVRDVWDHGNVIRLAGSGYWRYSEIIAKGWMFSFPFIFVPLSLSFSSHVV